MRPHFVAVSVLVVSGCSAVSCQLCGTWKSDEVATLEALRSCGWSTPERESKFGHGFFGRFVAEYEPKRSRGYFVEDGTADALWGPYEILDSGDDFIELSEKDSVGATVVRRLRIAGQCYQTPMGDQGCYETLCRQ